MFEAVLKQRLRQQEAIAYFGEYAIGCRDLDRLFNQAVTTVGSVLDVEMCKILELLPGDQELLLRAGIGWYDGLVGQVTVGAGVESQAGYTLLSEEPVIVDDLQQETRFHGPSLLFNHHVTSGISVMILGDNRPFGVLGAHTRAFRTFSTDDAHFLKSIANILASAIARFRAENEVRQSRDELAIILNGISEGVTVQDGNGRLVYANNTAANMLGYASADELVNTPIRKVVEKYQILDDGYNPFPLDRLPGRLVLKGEREASARVCFRLLETGEERWAIASARPVLSATGQAVLAVNIFRDITTMIRAERWQKLLAEAGELLVSTLDHEMTLSNVAQLLVTNLADWCTVHLVGENEQPYRLTVAHKDPAQVAMAQEYSQNFPLDYTKDTALMRVLRTGKSEYYPMITDSVLEASTRSPEQLEMIRALGLRSAMLVPLIARGRTMGVITLIWAESGRNYQPDEVEIVQSLAHRAAIAIENALLYQEAQALNAKLEQRVNERTAQLQLSNTRLLAEIEDRKRVELALRESETLLQSLFEQAPDATILVDASGRILRVNRQAEQVFGYERGELVHQSLDILLPARFKNRHAAHRTVFFNKLATRPMGAGLELYGLRKTGEEFPVDIMLSPVRMGDMDLVISSIRDITDQKRMQAELSETHRRLFESIEAERRSLSQDLHDGPIQELYGLSFNLEILGGSLSVPGDRELVDSSKEIVLSLVHTLRNICSDLRPPALSDLGLEKAIRSHAARTSEMHPDLSIELNLDSDGHLLSERVRLALFRVYQNAINNILRHASASRCSIRLEIGDRLLLEITDNGQGFQVPDKWVELARSGHFGLVSMQERVQAVDGRMSIRSSPGQGTTVLVEVPLEVAEAPARLPATG